MRVSARQGAHARAGQGDAGQHLGQVVGHRAQFVVLPPERFARPAHVVGESLADRVGRAAGERRHETGLRPEQVVGRTLVGEPVEPQRGHPVPALVDSPRPGGRLHRRTAARSRDVSSRDASLASIRRATCASASSAGIGPPSSGAANVSGSPSSASTALGYSNANTGIRPGALAVHREGQRQRSSLPAGRRVGERRTPRRRHPPALHLVAHQRRDCPRAPASTTRR